MKDEIANKVLPGRKGLGTEQSFTNRLPAMRRQLSVNRKSMPLLAMKYAIGEIIFLSVRFRLTMHPGTSIPRTTAESPSEVSHEVCNWQKLFLRPSHTCARVVGHERASDTRFFPGPCGGTKIEVSHETFDWLKNSQVARVLRRTISEKPSLGRPITFCSNRVEPPGGPNRRSRSGPSTQSKEPCTS